MREKTVCALFFSVVAASARGDPSTREKIERYFTGWYSYLPGSRVVATETREVAVPGFEAYRVERKSESKIHQESNVVLYSRGRDELFVGDVLYDPERAAAKRPFDGARDLSNIQVSLSQAFGVAVTVSLAGEPHGPLQSITLAIRQDRDAFANRGGFVSTDGATLLVGEFHAASESPSAFRERLFSKRPGIRVKPGRVVVTEFLDFQCERCRTRTPEVRNALAGVHGVVEVRLLPLVKSHDWAFAAAECAAALASVSPELYERYEEAIFAHGEGMTPAAVRGLASDVAEAGGATDRFESALASGDARRRVLDDIELAMRVGISATPSFVSRGTFVSGERLLIESYLWETGQASKRGSGSRSR